MPSKIKTITLVVALSLLLLGATIIFGVRKITSPRQIPTTADRVPAAQETKIEGGWFND